MQCQFYFYTTAQVETPLTYPGPPQPSTAQGPSRLCSVFFLGALCKQPSAGQHLWAQGRDTTLATSVSATPSLCLKMVSNLEGSRFCSGKNILSQRKGKKSIEKKKKKKAAFLIVLGRQREKFPSGDKAVPRALGVWGRALEAAAT